jgi:tetratricopeptide (TPR) repeat protein
MFPRAGRALILFVVATVAGGAAVATAAEPKWTMVRTPSITVIGDQSPSTLRDVAIQIEQFRAVVASLITNADRPLSLPTIVYVFGDRKSIQPFVPLYNGKPSDVAGFFQGGADANVMLLSLQGFDEAATIIFHEYTHLLVRNAVRSLPVWVNEGLAEYYSGYRLERGGKRATIGRPLPHHVLLLRERAMPLAELLAVDDSSPLYNEGSKRSIFYAESWALTHYEMSQGDGGKAINRYTTAIAEGRSQDEAFREAFGASPADVEKQLRIYVNRPALLVGGFDFKEGIATAAPGPPRTMTPGEANAWLGDLQRRIGREREAAERIDAALAADPSAAIGQVALGLLRLSQHRDEEGLEALRRASEMAPDDFLAQFAHGIWRLRTGEVRSKSALDEAVAALRRAIALNPNSADAYGWLAYAQMLSELSLNDARASIERAIQLAPGRVEYRLRWADIRILQDQYADAKSVLTRIAAIKTDRDAAAAAAQRLEAIQRYEQAEAARNAARAEATSRSSIRRDPSAAPSAPADRGDAAGSRSIGDGPGATYSRTTIKSPHGDVSFVLRQVGPGEERVHGLLIRIECTPSEVRVHVRADDDRAIVAAAKRMEDVELTQFLDDKTFTIGCGVRATPDTVLLTWRRDDPPVPGRAGTAVAIEFLPKDYVP